MTNVASWIGYNLWGQLTNLMIIGSTDFMRQTGKMYVVYGVISIIFIGIVLFLLYLEKRIQKIENKINNGQQ